MELALGKRKYLFCVDLKGKEAVVDLVQQVIALDVPHDFRILKTDPDLLVEQWFCQQKMGTYLYISGQVDWVKRVKNLAYDAGFSDHEMKTIICGPIHKKVLCCKCHGFNQVFQETFINCNYCNLELEVSDHYSRRLDAYLGYNSIK